MKHERYSIVIPFYNGLDTIKELVSRIDVVFSKLPYSYKIVIVDDSADPQKHSTLEDWFSENENITLVRLPENSGQHYATVKGLELSGDFNTITLDEDLQHHPEDIPKLIEKGQDESFDIIYGNRIQKDWRFWLGRLILTICFPGGPTTTCSFRLIRNDTVEKLIIQRPKFFELEGMLYRLRPNYGYVDVELDLETHQAKRSSYSIFKLYALVSNLIAYYSWFPIVTLSIVLLVIQSFAVFYFGVKGLLLLPLSVISVLTLTAYISTSTRKPLENR